MSSTECHTSIFAHRGIRICEKSELRSTDMWSELQQKASSILGFKLSQNNHEKIKKLAGSNVYCEELTDEQAISLQRQLEYLRTDRPWVETEWSSLAWQTFVFRGTVAPDANRPIENQDATMRILEDRTQRVVFSGALEKVDSRYPPIVSHEARPSVACSNEPWEYYRQKGGGRSGYAYCDISYRVSFRDWINTLAAEDRRRLHMFPLMRLLPSSTTYLPSLLMCEVKSSPDMINEARNYLALQAATMQHERLKLCWLARSTDAQGRLLDYIKKPSYFVIHLLALVGHEAHYYICRLRAIAFENLTQGREKFVTYEIVFQRLYNLEEEFGITTFFATLNKIYVINHTIGRDAQLAELKAALNSKCMDIPHQDQTFAWKCNLNEPVLVLRSPKKYKSDQLLNAPDPKAHVVTPCLLAESKANEAKETTDLNASTNNGRILLSSCIVSGDEDPRNRNGKIHKDTLSPRRNRSGLVR
ncbi:hypothetical protein MMC26_005435 [Xylographa opegraphella]|nr:hypothetical protein [Xylographa opegraphella]